MIIGGSAGLMIAMAFALSAPPTSCRARAVFSLNSLRFWRVPGPALRLESAATISPYATSATRSIACMIGMVAWPAQLTMFTFGAPTCSVRFTAGTT